jgi:hypothetical protein
VEDLKDKIKTETTKQNELTSELNELTKVCGQKEAKEAEHKTSEAKVNTWKLELAEKESKLKNLIEQIETNKSLTYRPKLANSNEQQAAANQVVAPAANANANANAAPANAAPANANLLLNEFHGS